MRNSTTSPTSPVRRGRPSDATKHDAILTAAQELFAASGFTATSMSAVAEAAGVSKLTAYRHFGSKDELFSKAIASRCEAMLGQFAGGPLPDQPPRDALIAFGTAFLALILGHQAFGIHRLIIAERERAPGLGHLFHAAAIAPTNARLADLLVRLGTGGAAPDRAAMDLLSLWRGRPTLDMELNLPPVDHDEHVAHCVDLCLAAWQAHGR